MYNRTAQGGYVCWMPVRRICHFEKKKKDSEWGKTTVIFFFKATWDTCKSAKEATQPAPQLLMQ